MLSGRKQSRQRGREARETPLPRIEERLTLQYRWIASSLLEQDEVSAAERLYRSALDVDQQFNWLGEAAVAQSGLGACLIRSDSYAEAERHLLAAIRGHEQPSSVRALEWTLAVNRIIDLYQATGRPDKAAQFRARVP